VDGSCRTSEGFMIFIVSHDSCVCVELNKYLCHKNLGFVLCNKQEVII
jgi:hypothetical protein